MCKCMDGSGCAVCKYWTQIGTGRRGLCDFYKLGDRLRITRGQIVETTDGKIQTTADTRCNNHVQK